MMPHLSTSASSNVFDANHKRERSSLLDDSIPLSLLPPMKRQRSSFKQDVIKAHATFARMFGSDNLDCHHDSKEASPSDTVNSVKKTWSKRTTVQRKELLGKVHPTAERFLSAKGVWNSVAEILDQHFTSTLSPASLPSPSPVNKTVEVVTANDKEEKDDKFHPGSDFVFPEPTLSSVAATARALCSTVSLATMKAAVAESASVTCVTTASPESTAASTESHGPPTATPSLVMTGMVPNPLLALQQEEEERDLPPLALVTAFPASTTARPISTPPPPAAPVSVASLSELDNDEIDEAPVWCLHDEWEVDPLVLLA